MKVAQPHFLQSIIAKNCEVVPRWLVGATDPTNLVVVNCDAQRAFETSVKAVLFGGPASVQVVLRVLFFPTFVVPAIQTHGKLTTIGVTELCWKFNDFLFETRHSRCPFPEFGAMRTFVAHFKP